MKNGIGVQNANALLAHGDGQVIDAQLSDQLLRRGEQFGQVRWRYARDQCQLLKIGADGRGAGIFAEVLTLGVDQYRDLLLCVPGR